MEKRKSRNFVIEAKETELLNMMENPNTPQKLARNRKIIQPAKGREIFIKSTGCKCKINAMIHADIVATKMMINA